MLVGWTGDLQIAVHTGAEHALSMATHMNFRMQAACICKTFMDT